MKIKYYKVVSFLLFLCISCQDVKRADKEINKEGSLFRLVSPSISHVNFNNHVEESFKNFFARNNYVYNGAGVAVGDIDNDGLSDIYFVGNEVSNKLYRNLGGFQFEDITSQANVSGGNGWHNGVVMADVNGDGLLDIYICRGGQNSSEKDRENLLYINQGNLKFKEMAKEYGLNDSGYSLMASFFDSDNDNDLDVYITNRPRDFFLNYKQVKQRKENLEDGYRDKLYVNEDGQFREIGKESGITQNFGFGLGLITTDIDDDGNVDVLVSNDYQERDYLYINKTGNQFKDELAGHFNHISFFAMGVDVVDFNNDGLEDVIQLDMLPEDYERSKTSMVSMDVELYENLRKNGFHNQYMHNMLQLNRGKGFFSDISQFAGVAKTDWSWSCLGSDFDNDGYRDLFITNGVKRDVWDKDAMRKFSSYMNSPQAKSSTHEQNAKRIISMFDENKIANCIFRNNQDLTFTKMTKEWGMDKESFSNGAATADLDNDGDLDLVVNNMYDPAFIYENTADENGNNYLKIKLSGPPKNMSGLGAKVTIKYDGKLQFQEHKTVRGYLSSVEPIVHFGLGDEKIIDTIEVVWKDGSVSALKKVKANQQIVIDYQNAKEIQSIEEINQPIFHEVGQEVLLSEFVHRENQYNDYKHQVLLPHKLSQLGPCITTADVNNDGLEDFFVGGAANQSGQIFLQQVDGTFVNNKQKALVNDARSEDTGAVFFDADGDQDQDLYVVSGGNEFSEDAPELVDRLYLNDGVGNFVASDRLPKISESGSCVVPIDFDADGDLDLFVGGRLIPRKYPKAPRSYILENIDNNFVDNTSTIAPEITNIGMVTSAVAADINGDKVMELVLVGEWMPITVFQNINGQLKLSSLDNLSETSGWWNNITAADIDGDGDIDLLAGNLGLNYKFKASPQKPFRIYSEDFDQNGTHDVFLSKEYENREVPIRGIECASEQMPRIGTQFKTYKEFANADIDEIIGVNLDKALKYEVTEFASVILENINGVLHIKKLPMQAQFSTVNGFIVEDFNKDGLIDILLAGNKFDVEIETTRADASVGLLLLGTEHGTFEEVDYQTSGYFVPYNVKSLSPIKISNKYTGILTGVNDGQLLMHIPSN